MMRRIALLILLSWVCAGCQTLPLAGSHEKITRNVTYATRGKKELRLDLYIPKLPRPAPVVVWIHGGAWKYGDKSFLIRVRRLTRSGIAVACVEYRRSWQAPWPAQREDCAEAIRWLRMYGREYGIDGERIGLSGDSSGGHVAALLGVTLGQPKIKAVCALYPPTDLVALGDRYGRWKRTNLITQLFDGPADAKRAMAFDASPVNHVRANAPPFLFLHGGHDRVVPIEQSRLLHARLQAAGADSALQEFPNLPHGFGLDKTMLAEVAAFFQKHL